MSSDSAVGSAFITLRLPVGDQPGSDARSLVDISRRAEDAGFSAVSISDHVVMGPRVERYPWGEFPFSPAAPWLEPLTVLSAIAAATSRVRLTTSILIAPLRPAALLAKVAATVDAVSAGRLELGVGTGWQEEEFEALGLDYSLRGRMLTDTVAACRALWSESPATFESPTVSFSEIWCEPRPVRPGGPPVLFSGTLTKRNLRRIVELGDGWIPIMGERKNGIAEGTARLRDLYSTAGRDPDELRVRSAPRIARNAGGQPDVVASVEAAEWIIEAGVTDVDLPLNVFVHTPDEIPAFFEAAAKAISSVAWVRS
jgi:probable F420-dependent oxidoreductase